MKIYIFFFELSSKPYVGMMGLTVSMCKLHEFETIFTSNDVVNNQYSIGIIFGSREIAYYMGVYAYFVPRITNIPHAIPNYVTGKYIFEIYYYR